MFEVGFTEVIVIAVVALIVLGPQRLPKAARMAGRFIRKARMSFENLKSEIEREIDADEMKQQFQKMRDETEHSISKPLLEAEQVIGDALHDAEGRLRNPLAASIETPVEAQSAEKPA
jgi:sec-independent protein translocase protein TatB